MVFSLSFIFLLSATCFLLWLIFAKAPNRIKKIYDTFPGPLQFPLIGSAYVLAVDTTDVMKVFLEMQHKYGPRIALRLINRYNVILTDPKDVETVLCSTVNINRNANYEAIRPWIGDGLLLNTDQKWHFHRKLITPTFHFKILNHFLHTFNTSSKTLVKVLQEVVARNGAEIDLFPFVNRCTLEIICGTAMGVQTDSQNLAANQNLTASEYGRAVHRFTDLVMYRCYRPWLEIPGLWRLTSQGKESLKCEKILLDFTEHVVNERRKQRAEHLQNGSIANNQITSEEDMNNGKRKSSALLDLLLEIQENDPKALSNEDLLAEINTFIFTGQDTITAHVTWTLILLGANPDHQDRVREELDRIFGDDPSRDVTPADIAEMKYLEICMKESLRLYPPASIMMREVKSDMELDDGTIIPAGGEATIFIFGMHRNPEIFPQPDTFDPERFTLENSVDRHPFSYIPFSAGSRNCIGHKFAIMEAKVMLANIFRHFIVQTVTPIADIKIQYASIIKPIGSLFSLQKRN